MENDPIRRGLQRFKTVAVASDPSTAFPWCERLTQRCSLHSYEEIDRGELSDAAHLAILRYDGESLRRCLRKLRERGCREFVLFYPPERAEEAGDLAHAQEVSAALPCPASEEEALESIRSVLPRLFERLHERTRSLQLQKIVDMAPAQVLLSKGRALFLNPEARRLFGVEDAAGFEKEVFGGLRERLPRRARESAVLTYGERELLATLGARSREDLYTFCELPPAFGAGRREFLSRIELVDRIKDRMVLGVGGEASLVLMPLKIGNYRAVVKSHGWLGAHTLVREVGEMVREHFPTLDDYGLWSPDMTVAVFAQPAEELAESFAHFGERLRVSDFSDDIAVVAQGALVEVRTDDLGAVVRLISRLEEEDLSVVDTKGFAIRESFFTAEGRDEGEVLEDILSQIMANRVSVKLLNLYEGLPVSSQAKILKVGDGKIVVTADRLQKLVMGLEKRVVIQSSLLPSDVEADLHLVDRSRPLAILKSPRLLHTSINNRRHTRVTVPSRFPVVMKIGRKHYSGFLHDLSISSVALHFSPGRFAENSLASKKAEVSFRLPANNEEGSVDLRLGGEILFSREVGEWHRVVVLFEAEGAEESHLFDYIYRRQRELLKELKSKIV